MTVTLRFVHKSLKENKDLHTSNSEMITDVCFMQTKICTTDVHPDIGVFQLNEPAALKSRSVSMIWNSSIIAAFSFSSVPSVSFPTLSASHQSTCPSTSICHDSLLYPLVGNQPHARKQSCTHRQVQTHTHIILQAPRGWKETSISAALCLSGCN